MVHVLLCSPFKTKDVKVRVVFPELNPQYSGLLEALALGDK